MVVSVKLTTKCNARCAECSAGAWMKDLPSYEMRLCEIKEFIKYSKLSGYRFKYIILSGGDPFLALNLVKIAKELRESGIVKHIQIYSNPMAYPEKLDEVIGYVDSVRVSDDPRNEKILAEMIRNHGRKIKRGPKRRHTILAYEFVSDSLPADCACKSYALSGTKVYWCSGSLSIGHRMRIPFDCVDLKENFLGGFPKSGKFNRPICAYCSANKKVRAIRPHEVLP